MPFYRPSRDDIRRRVQSDFRYEFGNDAVLIPGTVEHAFCESIVGLSHGVHGRLDQIYRDAFPHLASEPALVKWAAFYGMFRNRATYASGIMLFFGQVGATIPTGTIVARPDGFEYKVTAGATIEDSPIHLPVQARVPGAAGNAPSTMEMALRDSVVGVQSNCEPNSAGLTGGADAEMPEALRVRLLALLNEPEGGGKMGDYVRWAKQVTGVTRAWEFGNTPKVGNVTVLFMQDDDATPFPEGPELQAVKDWIMLFAPTGLPPVEVLPPVPHPIALTIELTLEAGAILADVRAAIIVSLENMIKARAEPAVQDGVLFYRSWISEAISTTTGELDHKLTVPSDDITLAQWDLVTLGVVTWS